MSLLAEYALTPDIFDSTSYSNDEVGRIYLQQLKEVLLCEGLVRDLRDGRWSSFLSSESGRSWHLRGKELLKKLRLQKRLRERPAVSDVAPTTDQAWCEEALASHDNQPLTGIVTTQKIAGMFRHVPLVACIDQLQSASWWAGRSPSIRLTRTIEEYLQHLRLILHCASHLMFIDPHLDPNKPRYSGFIKLLQEASGRSLKPLIEIHRVCYFKSCDKRNQYDESGWMDMFRSWIGPLKAAGLNVEVFIWDDFHDRYVISNLVGISLQNGFDITRDVKQRTTWNRLGRNERDDIQREFEKDSRWHNIKHKFRIPNS